MILFISGQEIVVIILIVVLLFGTKRLPEIVKGLGKGVNEFKKATSDIKREFDHQTDSGIGKDVKKVKHQIQEASSEIKKNLDDSPLAKGVKDIKKNVDKLGKV
jgi:sec-independent protein translocase protein TatA